MKHHYIPQFYLKPWQGPDGKIAVFQRRSDGLIVSNRMHRKATGYERNLYRLPGVSPADEHKMESAFMAPIDDEAVRIVYDAAQSRTGRGVQKVLHRPRTDAASGVSIKIRCNEAGSKPNT